MMKLFYSITSPYSRKALLTARALGLGDKVTLEVGSSMDPATKVDTVNPLGKVPALLLENSEAIFDSPVIVEHFLREAGADRTSDVVFKQLQLQAVADGIMDAAVNTVMDSRKPDGDPSPFWHERWRTSIMRSVKHIEDTHIALLGDWAFGTIGTACALDYLGFRLPELAWQQEAPKLAEWFDSIKDHPDFAETDPRNG